MEHHVLRWTGSPSEDHPSVSNVSTQSLVGLQTYRTSHGHDIHLDTSQDYQPNPMADHYWMHPLQVMHNHPDFMTDLGSCLCTRQPTSLFVCISLMDRQCPVPQHRLDLWQLTISSSHSLAHILGWTLVPVIIRPCYINWSSNICPGTYATRSLDLAVQYARHLENHIVQACLDHPS